MREQTIRQLAERRQEFEKAETNAFRVVDGPVTVDAFGDHLLAAGGSSEAPSELSEAFPEAASLSWKRLDVFDKEPPSILWGAPPPSPFLVQENGLAFTIDFEAGYSQGIFLDQRENRALVRSRSEGLRVLNLFSYTCAFSVTAAAGGGISTSLDLSGPYLEWGKRNLIANDIDPEEHYFCKGDAFDWLARFAKSGRQFGGIIIDPPTFSRSGKKKVFRAEEDYAELVRLAALVTEPDGWILATTNCQRLDNAGFQWQVEEGLQEAGKRFEITRRPMPFDFDQSDYLKTLFVELA